MVHAGKFVQVGLSMLIKLVIDNMEIEVEEGSTLLFAANRLGITIPAICNIGEKRNSSSCLVCLVKDCDSGQLVPACSSLTRDNMKIETDNDEVRQARRESLEILLSEHVGDCEAPCTLGCPLSFDIPQIMDSTLSTDIIYRNIIKTIPFPSIVSRICDAPCEKVCRRRIVDSPVGIRQIISKISDSFSDSDIIPEIKVETNRKIAVLGQKIGLLGAAWKLCLEGNKVTVFMEKKIESMFLNRIPPEIVSHEIKRLKVIGVDFVLSPIPEYNDLSHEFDAILVSNKMDIPEKFVFSVNTGSHPGLSIKFGLRKADEINRILSHSSSGPPLFNSKTGKLKEDEIGDYITDHRCRKESDSNPGSRCFHCDCDNKGSCLLRSYSTVYGVNQNKFRISGRDKYQKRENYDFLAYIPGKCIKCGRCVRIAREHGSDITFINRGYSSRIFVPSNVGGDNMNEITALYCIEGCPTSALVLNCNKETGYES